MLYFQINLLLKIFHVMSLQVFPWAFALKPGRFTDLRIGIPGESLWKPERTCYDQTQLPYWIMKNQMETEGLYNTKFGTEWYWSGAIATYRSSRLRPATLLKKRLWHRCFPVNFVKFLITSFNINHLWWLLLNIEKKYLSSFPIKTIKQIIFCSVAYEKKRKKK